MYECPGTTGPEAIVQAVLDEQVLGTRTVVLVALLSVSVTFTQSKVTVSWQTFEYHTDTWLAPAPGVKVCEIVLSPLVAEAAPATPEKPPPCAAEEMLVLPLVDQPLRFPVSKSPLVMPGRLGGGGGPIATSS